jgi:hypothetical protein
MPPYCSQQITKKSVFVIVVSIYYVYIVIHLFDMKAEIAITRGCLCNETSHRPSGQRNTAVTIE